MDENVTATATTSLQPQSLSSLSSSSQLPFFGIKPLFPHILQMLNIMLMQVSVQIYIMVREDGRTEDETLFQWCLCYLVSRNFVTNTAPITITHHHHGRNSNLLLSPDGLISRAALRASAVLWTRRSQYTNCCWMCDVTPDVDSNGIYLQCTHSHSLTYSLTHKEKKDENILIDI